MKKELSQLITAAKAYTDFHSIANGARLRIAIEAAEKALKSSKKIRKQPNPWIVKS